MLLNCSRHYPGGVNKRSDASDRGLASRGGDLDAIRGNDGTAGVHCNAMGVVVHPGRLRLELARRGWAAADLAREAGVSHPTISAALSGRPVAAKSLSLIAGALGRVPPNAQIDQLVLGNRGVADLE